MTYSSTNQTTTMTYDTYRFSLGSQRSICPKCGHRDFKPYIDRATGKPLDVNVCGRCNHVNSCRYHLSPSCRSVRVIDVSLPPYSLTASEDIGDWLLRNPESDKSKGYK